MNRLSAASAIALLTALGAATAFYLRSDDQPPVSANKPTNIPDHAVRLDPTLMEDVSGPQWEVDSTTTEQLIPARPIHDLNSDNVEMIGNLPVAKDRNCEVHIVKYAYAPDGTLQPVYACAPHGSKEVDIYTTYSNETLETMAYADSHAAYILSARAMSKDYDRALAYGLRSAALSNDPRSMYQLLLGNPEHTTNPQVHRASLERRYVLTAIAQALDVNSPFHDKTIRAIERFGGNTIDTSALDREVDTHLATINAIRAEVGID